MQAVAGARMLPYTMWLVSVTSGARAPDGKLYPLDEPCVVDEAARDGEPETPRSGRLTLNDCYRAQR